MTPTVTLSQLVTLDFETYYDSDYTLRNGKGQHSLSEYVRSHRFHAHMVGLKVGKRPVRVLPASKIAAALRKIDWTRHDLLAHNCAFDGFILSQHYGVQPRFLFDTLSMARALHGNEIAADLNSVAAYYHKGNKLPGVLEQLKGVRELDEKSELYQQAAAYCAQDVALCHDIFLDMLAQFPAEELRVIDIALRCFTNPRLRLDIPRAQAELAREIAAKTELLTRVTGLAERDAAAKIIGSDRQFAELLQAEGVAPPTKTSPATGKDTWAFAKTDLAFTELLSHESARVRDLVQARLMVKSSLNETRAGRLLSSAQSAWGTLPVLYHYFGAHTGRFSAGDKRNYQNLPRGGELRKSIIAPKGHLIAVCDSSQIEARTLAWLAGQDDLMQDFRLNDAGQDRDVYCKLADSFYGRVITKADELERQVGKVARLGLGYGMGAARFQHTLATGSMGPPVRFSLDECRLFVQVYRQRSPFIVQFWRRCEQIILDMAAGRSGDWRCIAWEKERIWLPNGLSLKYPSLRQIEDEEGKLQWSYLRRDGRARIYGGLLCENITQALARIIVVHDQMPLIAQRYPVVMTTHDETVALPRAKEGQKALDFMVRVMKTSPDWAPDLPLNAEGKVDVNYSK